jgi:hypothetical protein
MFAKLLQMERLGVAVTGADAVRALLNLGLEAATAEKPAERTSRSLERTVDDRNIRFMEDLAFVVWADIYLG